MQEVLAPAGSMQEILAPAGSGLLPRSPHAPSAPVDTTPLGNRAASSVSSCLATPTASGLSCLAGVGQCAGRWWAVGGGWLGEVWRVAPAAARAQQAAPQRTAVRRPLPSTYLAAWRLVAHDIGLALAVPGLAIGAGHQAWICLGKDCSRRSRGGGAGGGGGVVLLRAAAGGARQRRRCKARPARPAAPAARCSKVARRRRRPLPACGVPRHVELWQHSDAPSEGVINQVPRVFLQTTDGPRSKGGLQEVTGGEGA